MKPANQPTLALPEGYADWLMQLKGQIAQARQLAALAVNAKLVPLYGRSGSASCNASGSGTGAPRSLTYWPVT